MPLMASAEATSAAAPPAVWDRLTDGRRWADWSAASEWMVVESALETGRYVTVKRKRGRQTAYLIEAAAPGERLSLVLQFGPLARLRIAWTLAASGDGTLVVQTVESDGPLRRWLSDPLARKAAESLAGDPERLAALASG